MSPQTPAFGRTKQHETVPGCLAPRDDRQPGGPLMGQTRLQPDIGHGMATVPTRIV